MPLQPHPALPLTLIAIVAMTPERIIGRDGKLPWHLPADLAFFKRATSGHPVVMGRKTFQSIGKPLPLRRNIVVTRDPTWSAPDVEVIHQPEDLPRLPGLDGTVFIIGGAEIYQAFLPLTDELWISRVHQEHPGDTRFPAFEHLFSAVEVLQQHPDFTVQRWRRQSNAD